MNETKGDRICISVPAQEDLSEIVRLATTAIANRIGLDLDQSEDLNTAIEEVFRYFCSSCSLEGSDISIVYSILDGRLEIQAGSTLNSLIENETKIGRYCRFILEKVTDGYRELSEDGRFALVIEKQTNN